YGRMPLTEGQGEPVLVDELLADPHMSARVRRTLGRLGRTERGICADTTAAPKNPPITGVPSGPPMFFDRLLNHSRAFLAGGDVGGSGLQGTLDTCTALDQKAPQSRCGRLLGDVGVGALQSGFLHQSTRVHDFGETLCELAGPLLPGRSQMHEVLLHVGAVQLCFAGLCETVQDVPEL